MDIHQLKTFVAVAQAGTITRASELLHLSQPAVSAHIKSLEETLGLSLFERTAKGMSLSHEGTRLLVKAEKALAVHQEMLDEAQRIKGNLTGTLRLGAGSNSNHEAIGKLLTAFSARWPLVEVTFKHGTSLEILAGLRDGSLDAGFYNEAGEAPSDLLAVEISKFKIFVTSAPGLVETEARGDFRALAELPWIYPTASACCGRAAESLFQAHGVKPQRIISVDREDLTRTLVASGLGVGLLHEATARKAELRGELDVLLESPNLVRILFVHRASRASDPLLEAARWILRPEEVSSQPG
jgi:DNA-binding transcriptional LysR family regulator